MIGAAERSQQRYNQVGNEAEGPVRDSIIPIIRNDNDEDVDIELGEGEVNSDENDGSTRAHRHRNRA